MVLLDDLFTDITAFKARGISASETPLDKTLTVQSRLLDCSRWNPSRSYWIVPHSPGRQRQAPRYQDSIAVP